VKRSVYCALAMAFGLLPLECATLVQLSVDDMIVKSTSIVRGKVTGSYTAFSGPVIYTHYAIQVSERFKGAPQGSVDVAAPGGSANNVRQTFSGAPEFHIGDEYVFFLWTGPSGMTQVVGLTQGLFAVSPGGASDPVATRLATRETMLSASTGLAVKDQPVSMRVSQLRSRIASTLAANGGAK